MDLSVHILDRDASYQTTMTLLKQLDVNVEHSQADHFALYNTYREAFSEFHHINSADVVIIGSKISNDNALQLLYAILKNKPIIAPNRLQYDTTDSLTQAIIKKAAPHIYLKDITTLEETSLHRFLTEIHKQPTNYHLEPAQAALIRARVRAFFREAVSPSVAA